MIWLIEAFSKGTRANSFDGGLPDHLLFSLPEDDKIVP